MIEEKNKIMIVDDDDFLANMYATKFGLSGVETEICGSGESLLEKLRAGATSDLILLDIVMSSMSGLDALRKMREEKLGEGIPIVMLTNQNDEKDIALAKSLGIAAYIVKASATPLEVVNKVAEIIKSSKTA
jgi:CheY-like chemotaxis protein